MSYLDKYPKELTVGREKIEASVVFCMWKETDHFLDYGREINPEKDLLDEDARFYFGLGKQMVDLGYKSLDDASIYSYLDGKEVLSNGFNRRGGYKTVDQLKSILNIENMESYYDEIVKSNMLMKLHDKGFNVLTDIAKFKKMTSSQLYDYFEFQLDNVFLNRGSGVKIEDLDIDQELIDSANSGEDMGLSYGKLAPLLNYHTMGLHKSNVHIFGGFSGSGKAQSLDSKLMTPTGYKLMKDINVGDEIFGEDGKVHYVTGVFPQGKKDMYEVIFSDNSKTVTCDEHLWDVQTAGMKCYNKGFKTKTLREIVDSGLYDQTATNPYKKWKHFVPMTKPLEFNNINKLEIPPYLLGLLIGDGGLSKGNGSVMITVGETESDIVEYLTEYCNSNNLLLNIAQTKKGAKDYRFTRNSTSGNNHLRDSLNKLGLIPSWSYTKFIPHDYLYASVEDRIELLSGLIDSDGEVNSSNYTYSTSSEKLAYDVQFLVQSLGGTARVANRQTYYTHKGEKKAGRPSFRLYIKMPRSIQAFKSEKHKRKFKMGQNEARRVIREVNYIGKMEAQCISTSNPSQLYLTDEMIVTHNTSFAVNTYVMSILDAGEKVTIIANEMNKKAWQHLFLATILSQKLGYYGIPRKKQKMGNFNDEQNAKLQEAIQYYNEHYKGQIKFVKIYDYSIDDVKRVIRKMKKQGFDWAIYDTFKAENAASDKVTGELIEASKQLLQVAEKEEVGVLITMQLAIYMENTRFLTAQTLSNAKGVKEIVSELILTRKLWQDEFTGEKYDVKPYRFKKDPITNKYTKIKEEITLNPESRYMIMFLDKTRNDEDGTCILYEFKGAWNSWKEIGYCTPKHVRT